MSQIMNIILHCSDSLFGSAAEIRRWHQANGWRDIGYHFVINNGLIIPDIVDKATGKLKQTGLYLPCMDGQIEIGRRLDGDKFLTDNEAGAHALGYNASSIGIVWIGVDDFTPAQFLSGAKLITQLWGILGRDIEVKGHYQVSKNRTCPNFNVPLFVEDIPRILNSGSRFLPTRYKVAR